MRSVLAISLAALALAGCARGNLGINDLSAVDTPAYRANKVLFVDPQKGQETARVKPLSHAYEIAARKPVEGGRRSIRNGTPIAIIVSRAYVPASVFACIPRKTDSLFRSNGPTKDDTRDIAVLLDISTVAGSQDFIAVWYQRGVRPDDLLNFENLLVYATEAWDNRYPPYFRLRLVDVSAERNTAVRSLLERAQATSGTVLSLAGVAGAAPILGLAASAAQQVLANERNIALVDFTFQLYGEALLDDAGGIPLAVLQTGGAVVTAPPCGQTNEFWNNSLSYDFRSERIGIGPAPASAPQDVPFVFATIVGADLAVPTIVKDRSAAILARLTDPKATQRDIDAASRDADGLQRALAALVLRENFLAAPSRDSLDSFIEDVKSAESDLGEQERRFFMNSLFQITGRSFTSATAYADWLKSCPAATVNPETRKLDAKAGIKDETGNPCWPDLG